MNTQPGSRSSAFARTRLLAGTAPSLRVPVTAGNRAFLRWLRDAELSAWQAADARRGLPGRPHARRFFCRQAG